MELRDVNLYRLESAARKEALRRSMVTKRHEGDGPRHRVGGALIALGLRISGEPSPTHRGRRAMPDLP
jgi:hypothetical protein